MSAQSLKDDHRISPRKKIRTRVVFEDENNEEFLYFLSTDISIAGIFIESRIPLLNHTKVFLKFSLYEGDDPIQVTGEIMRLAEGKRGRGRRPKKQKIGIGIRFLELSTTQLKKIQDFIVS